MLQFAKSNAARNRGMVTLASLVAAYAIAACSSSESPTPVPAVASGGSGFGGATQPQNGGSTQAQTGGATQSATGGASNNSNTGGASNNSNTGGASNNSNTGGASNNSNTGGASNNSNTGGASNNSNTGGASNNSDTGGASNNSSTGGASANAGGSSSTGGAAQAGGTTSGGGAGGAGGAVACLPVTKALISDFTYTAGGSASTSDGSFGDYTTTYSGGTFVYPASTSALQSDVTQSNWHIRGNVTDYAGFGLYNGKGCGKIDASAYKGISFVISGTITTGVTATENTLTMTVGTAADEISSTWLNANKTAGTADVAANFGRCTPTANRWDGTCASPSKSAIPVTTTPTTVTVLWADLIGGKPDASVTATELTSINWVLPNPTGVGTTSVVPYPVDIVIDDIQFVQ